MKTKIEILNAAVLSFMLISTASAAESNIEQFVRDLDSQWSAAAAAKDLDKALSYYSDDAVVLPPHAESARTPEAIRQVWKELLEITVAGNWRAANVEAAKSADIAYVRGTYEGSFKARGDASGRVFNDRGKYLAIWKKQMDGSWKCVASVWNSDLRRAIPEKVRQPGT